MKNKFDFKIGDEVYSCSFGFGLVVDVGNSDFPVICEFNGVRHEYLLDGRSVLISNSPSIFHVGAVEFDSLGRLISVDYGYRPVRFDFKIKLPHEFSYGEEVLVKNVFTSEWFKRVFRRFDFETKSFLMVNDANNYGYCVPYFGNEKYLGEETYCTSGLYPSGYFAGL